MPTKNFTSSFPGRRIPQYFLLPAIAFIFSARVHALAQPDLENEKLQDIPALEQQLNDEKKVWQNRFAELEEEIFLYDEACILRDVALRKQNIERLKADVLAERKKSKTLKATVGRSIEEFEKVTDFEKELLLDMEEDWLEDRVTDLQERNWGMAKRIMSQADGFLPVSILTSTMWDKLTEEELDEAISYIKKQRKKIETSMEEELTNISLLEDFGFEYRTEEFAALLHPILNPDEKDVMLLLELENGKKRLKKGLHGSGTLSLVNLQAAYRRLESLDSRVDEDFEGFDETKVLLVFASMELNKYDKAEHTLDSLLKEVQSDSPLYSTALLQRLEISFVNKAYEAVWEEGKNLLKHPDLDKLSRSRARYLTGLSGFLLNKPEEGRKILEKIKEGSSFWFYGQFYIALWEASEGDFLKAEDRLLVLLEGKQENILSMDLEQRIKLALGYIYFDAGLPVAAFKAFREIPDHSPFSPTSNYGIAWCLVELEQYDEALEQFLFCKLVGKGTLLEYEAVFSIVDLLTFIGKYDAAERACLELAKDLQTRIDLRGAVKVDSVELIEARHILSEISEVGHLKDQVEHFTGRSKEDEVEEITGVRRLLRNIDSELFTLSMNFSVEMNTDIMLERLMYKADKKLAEIGLAKFTSLKSSLSTISESGSSHSVHENRTEPEPVRN